MKRTPGKKKTAKPDPSAEQVETYFARLPEDARAALETLRKTIQSAAPEAVDTISYGMPAFRYRGHPLVGYAAFTDHCSFFPMSPEVLAAHKKDLERFKTAKGTIQFTVGRPLPAALVKKIVKARMKENDERWG
jgi:uncharacterized protein YdhG (YjbR/CyaY superfamily)